MATPEVALQEITDLWARTDNDGRKEIRNFVNRAELSVSAMDITWEVLPELIYGPLRLVLARIGLDLGLFRMIAESNTPLKVSDLAVKTGASAQVLARILRTMAAFGQLQETGEDEFGPNDLARTIIEPKPAGAVGLLSDVMVPSIEALPAVLAEAEYQTTTANGYTGFQKRMNTRLSIFEWLSQHPKHAEGLGHLMALERVVNWVDCYPVDERLGLQDFAGEVLMVDVGGSFGSQAAVLRQKYPAHPGRVIVQDLPGTIAKAKPIAGVEFMEHDFFAPQPVKGAKLYFLRHILHNWTDADCVRILAALRPAMGPDSAVVIDEFLIPPVGVSQQAASLDILMMAVFNAVERTRAEFEALLDQAGFRTVDVHTFDPRSRQSVIIAVAKEVS